MRVSLGLMGTPAIPDSACLGRYLGSALGMAGVPVRLSVRAGGMAMAPPRVVAALLLRQLADRVAGNPPRSALLEYVDGDVYRVRLWTPHGLVAANLPTV